MPITSLVYVTLPDFIWYFPVLPASLTLLSATSVFKSEMSVFDLLLPPHDTKNAPIMIGIRKTNYFMAFFF
jgi:hypothetical protein